MVKLNAVAYQTSMVGKKLQLRVEQDKYLLDSFFWNEKRWPGYGREIDAKKFSRQPNVRVASKARTFLGFFFSRHWLPGSCQKISSQCCFYLFSSSCKQLVISRSREVLRKKTSCTMTHTSGHVASARPSNKQSQLVLASSHLHRLSFMTHCDLRYTPVEGRLASNVRVEAKKLPSLPRKASKLTRSACCRSTLQLRQRQLGSLWTECSDRCSAFTSRESQLYLFMRFFNKFSSRKLSDRGLVCIFLTWFHVSCTCNDCSCISLVHYIPRSPVATRSKGLTPARPNWPAGLVEPWPSSAPDLSMVGYKSFNVFSFRVESRVQQSKTDYQYLFFLCLCSTHHTQLLSLSLSLSLSASLRLSLSLCLSLPLSVSLSLSLSVIDATL